MTVVTVLVDTCSGCGACVRACPTDVFRLDETAQKAVAQYEEDCCACLLCLEDCPTDSLVIDVPIAGMHHRSSIYAILRGEPEDD